MMYSTFSARKTGQKRLRAPSDLGSAGSLWWGQTGKYVKQMEHIQSAKDSDVLYSTLKPIAQRQWLEEL